MLSTVLCGLQLVQVLLHCGQIILNRRFADPGPLRPALETFTYFTAQSTSLSYIQHTAACRFTSMHHEYYKLCYSMVVGDFFHSCSVLQWHAYKCVYFKDFIRESIWINYLYLLCILSTFCPIITLINIHVHTCSPSPSASNRAPSLLYDGQWFTSPPQHILATTQRKKSRLNLRGQQQQGWSHSQHNSCVTLTTTSACMQVAHTGLNYNMGYHRERQCNKCITYISCTSTQESQCLHVPSNICPFSPHPLKLVQTIA